MEFPVFFLLLISNFILWSEKIICMGSAFLNVITFILWPNMWSVLDNVPCALEKNLYSAVAGGSAYF